MMIKQVILVRKDLNMNIGKTASQVAHAAMLFTLYHMKNNIPFTSTQLDWMFQEVRKDPNWTWGGMKKVVLGVEDAKEMLLLVDFAQQYGIEAYFVVDETLNCITAAAIGPDLSEKIDKVTDHLKLLGRE